MLLTLYRGEFQVHCWRRACWKGGILLAPTTLPGGRKNSLFALFLILDNFQLTPWRHVLTDIKQILYVQGLYALMLNCYIFTSVEILNKRPRVIAMINWSWCCYGGIPQSWVNGSKARGKTFPSTLGLNLREQ